MYRGTIFLSGLLVNNEQNGPFDLGYVLVHAVFELMSCQEAELNGLVHLKKAF